MPDVNAPRSALKRSRDYSDRLVVFDTNVIEQRYLAPLLRGEPCRDFALLRTHDPPYHPTVYVKSYYEICQHAKQGKSFPWLSAEYSYPGGISTGRRILEQLGESTTDENLYWWFNVADDWRGLDWREEEARVRALVVESERPAALREVAVRQEFSAWKFALTRFCERIWDVLEGQMTILTAYDVFGENGEFQHEVFALDQEMASRCLVPNEDFEIVSAALSTRASAFVTLDRALLGTTAVTIDLHRATAFVHADRLNDALTTGFAFRWVQPTSRGRGP